MPDALTQALAVPGISWVFAAAFVAGIVRGFAGFGTAMIFLPVAAQVLSPVWSVAVLAVMDLIGPLPAIPRALKDGHPRDLARLVAGTLVALPLGLAVLLSVDPSVFKIAVSMLSLGLLVLLIAGLRYRGELTPPLIYATGGLAGFLGGAVAIPGPPVILLYMASPHPAHVIRANNTVFLFCYDVLMLIGLALAGKLGSVPVVLGLITALPYLAGNLVGGWIFRPGLERVYRWVAYGIIATSASSGLWSVLGG
ncbi:sulfite exporter TauE/SafE family protein [Marimonas arenosa]|uniref:Probable membrane transporter protein n=1 Tax=Marimonas arenosa TaxID=1795305 RepID=A0AAE4B2M3_9RHOB|nr:sulfite exporter TauE/SafE family protein [Marimonas arenosa]MDQ2089178.1 sulfite exporter TauE/SafE family protein [Marimonas arenosa]